MNFPAACTRGVKNAFKLHMQLTGGLPLTFAPEAFIQGQIALELAKLNVFVSLETSVYETLADAGAELRGRPSKRMGGRIDLVTWWKNKTPRLLIEVKKLRHKEAISADAKRLRQMLGKGGSLRYGLVVVYADAKKAKTITSRINHAAKTKGCKLKKRTGPVPFDADWDNGEKWHYEIACFSVKARPKHIP
jgi:hypothetical protein